jgi:hypothetical protein
VVALRFEPGRQRHSALARVVRDIIELDGTDSCGHIAFERAVRLGIVRAH